MEIVILFQYYSPSDLKFPTIEKVKLYCSEVELSKAQANTSGLCAVTNSTAYNQ